MIDDAITILTTGTTVTTGAASASVTLPTNAAGKNPRVIRINVASGSAYVKLGKTTATATANDIMVTTGAPLLLNTNGYDTLAYLQFSSAQSVNITALS